MLERSKINPWAIALGALLGFVVLSRFFEVDIQRKGQPPAASTDEEKAVQAFLRFKKIKAETIPSGVPNVYGEELGVSFDNVQESMNKMVGFGPTYGTEEQKIVLEGEELKRYIKIAEQTACQHCCGVKTLVKEDGSAACGCAHSIVMRGLAAYLIQNYSDKLSDDQILVEIKEWQKVFFPKQILSAKFDELKAAGDQDIETLLQEFPDFLPQMVGGC